MAFVRPIKMKNFRRGPIIWICFAIELQQNYHHIYSVLIDRTKMSFTHWTCAWFWILMFCTCMCGSTVSAFFDFAQISFGTHLSWQSWQFSGGGQLLLDVIPESHNSCGLRSCLPIFCYPFVRSFFIPLALGIQFDFFFILNVGLALILIMFYQL